MSSLHHESFDDMESQHIESVVDPAIPIEKVTIARVHELPCRYRSHYQRNSDY